MNADVDQNLDSVAICDMPEWTENQLAAMAEWGACFLAADLPDRADCVFEGLQVIAPRYYAAAAGLAAVAMMREDWVKAEGLLHEALELPGGDRDEVVVANLAVVRSHVRDAAACASAAAPALAAA